MKILTCLHNGHIAWAMIFEPGMAVPANDGPFTYTLE